MKITKTYLKKLIKEELQNVLEGRRRYNKPIDYGFPSETYNKEWITDKHLRRGEVPNPDKWEFSHHVDPPWRKRIGGPLIGVYTLRSDWVEPEPAPPEPEWTSDYEGTPDPNVWEFSHMAGGVAQYRRIDPDIGPRGPLGGSTRKRSRRYKEPVYDENEVAARGGYITTDDYDGDPGPAWAFSHDDPKSGHTFYKKPKDPNIKPASYRDKPAAWK